MQTATMEVSVPKALLAYNIDQDKVQQLVHEWLVLDLFTDDQISSGKATQLLGISRREFLRLLHRRRIAYIDFGDEELHAELNAVASISL